MLTNNNKEKVLVDDLLECSLVIDLPKIKLYNAEEEYTGNGSIYLKSDGTFQLKFFNDADFSDTETIQKLMEDNRTTLLPFKMEASDHNKKKYICNHLTNNQPVLKLTNFDIHGNIESNFSIGYHSKIVFYGDYALPMHKIASTKTTVGKSYWFTDIRDIWEIELDSDLTLVFSKYDKYVELAIIHNGDFDLRYNLVNAIVSTFDFLTGKETEPVYTNIYGKSHRLYSRRNMLLAKSTFSGPIVMGHNHGHDFTENHTSLFKLYFNYIMTPVGKRLPDIHKRIVSASRGYIFASGLVISIQIESICKEFFGSYYAEDKTYRAQALEAIDLLENADTKKFIEIINRIKATIPKGERKTVSVKNILVNLAQTGIVGKTLIKPWIKMRNLSAHGDKDTEGDWTTFLHETYLCKNLYYQLVFHLIGYESVMTYHQTFDKHIMIDLKKSISQK